SWRARKPFADVASKCLVNVAADALSGVTVPAVGPQCAADVGAPGHPVDARGLSDAMVTLLSTWVERIGPHAEPLQPNIILILTDDQRADTTTSEFMPKLNDELLSAGVNFPNGFASNPVCCPSRSTILTGQYAHTHGVLTNDQGDPQHPTGGAWAFSDGSTVATWLQTAGYHTGLFGKYLNEY